MYVIYSERGKGGRKRGGGREMGRGREGEERERETNWLYIVTVEIIIKLPMVCVHM